MQLRAPRVPETPSLEHLVGGTNPHRRWRNDRTFRSWLATCPAGWSHRSAGVSLKLYPPVRDVESLTEGWLT